MHSERGFIGDFKKFFLRGIAALLPTLLTIAILIWAYHLVDQYIGRYITSGFIAVLARTAGAPTPSTVDPDADTLRYGVPTGELDKDGRRLTYEYLVIHHPAHRGNAEQGVPRSLEYKTALWRVAFAKYKLGLVGFFLAIALVYFVGFFVASFIGRTAWGILERVQERAPLISAIYPYVKQITDFLFTENRVAFRGVVAVEYPRKGMWSLGLLTGEAMQCLSKATNEDLVSVFIPSSPTPVTGYVVTIPRSDVIELSLSIDEALRFTISGGVIKPPTERSGRDVEAQALTAPTPLASLQARPLAEVLTNSGGRQDTSTRRSGPDAAESTAGDPDVGES